MPQAIVACGQIQLGFALREQRITSIKHRKKAVLNFSLVRGCWSQNESSHSSSLCLGSAKKVYWSHLSSIPRQLLPWFTSFLPSLWWALGLWLSPCLFAWYYYLSSVSVSACRHADHLYSNPASTPVYLICPRTDAWAWIFIVPALALQSLAVSSAALKRLAEHPIKQVNSHKSFWT